jgi:hypothetical protein
MNDLDSERQVIGCSLWILWSSGDKKDNRKVGTRTRSESSG